MAGKQLSNDKQLLREQGKTRGTRETAERQARRVVRQMLAWNPEKIILAHGRSCPECGYTTHRDVAAAQIVRNRGLSGVGRILDRQ